MIIATFGSSTGWAGKKITFENDVLLLEGHGPISAADVMEYDRQGHLVWANDGTRAWIGAKSRMPAVTQVSPPADVGDRTEVPSAQVAQAERPIETYKVFYLGGHSDYPKQKVAEIRFHLFEDRFEFEPTATTKKWFAGLTIPYDTVHSFEIVQRQVDTLEGLLGGIDSHQLNQANNIHINYESDTGTVLIRFEMLSGFTVMGQAKKCLQLEDRIRISKIREKFRQTQAPLEAVHEQPDDIPTQIERLAGLRDRGIITEAEFEAKKTELLSRM